MSILSRRGRTHVAISMMAVALGLGPLRLMEMCVAADGHMTLESAHADQNCESHVLRHHASSSTVSSDESGTLPCVDVAAIRVVDRGGDRRVVLGVTDTGLVTRTTLAAAWPGSVRAAPDALLDASQSTPLLRSVVIIA